MQDTTIKRVSWWIGLAAFALVAWQAGKFTWYYQADTHNVLTSKKSANESAAPQATRVGYASWNLFGQQQQRVARPVEQIKETPKTQLRLKLLGVVVGVNPQDSMATVAEQNGTTEDYKINESLPGNAILVDVESDYILLSRSGKLEKLTFDDQDLSNFVAATHHRQTLRQKNRQKNDQNSGNQQPRIDTPEQFMDVAQARLDADPQGALASVGLAPAANNGTTAGYVYDGKNPMLAAMNMQKGDVIRAINGHTLGNMEVDRTKLQELYNSGLLEVEIERAGATFTISYPIPQ